MDNSALGSALIKAYQDKAAPPVPDEGSLSQLLGSPQGAPEGPKDDGILDLLLKLLGALLSDKLGGQAEQGEPQPEQEAASPLTEAVQGSMGANRPRMEA